MSNIAFRFVQRLLSPNPVNVPIAEGDRIDEALNKLQGQINEFSGSTPTKVASDKIYKVKANTQALMSEEIDLEGELDLEGILVEVS